LVSAGLLTFPQGLGFVFGANVGTTGTGWLVALIGVRVSLTAAALPMIFVGALVKLLARGRLSASGAALAGFGLVLFGLTTLQQGMGGLAERLHPADLPAVLAGPGAGWFEGMIGVLTLVLVGLAMTAVMQSSTAAIAITMPVHYAGAVGLDQACALIIGQNIGTATSSAMAAIGASTTAKRLAVAYVFFKLIAAVIALALFPIVTPMLIRASNTVDGVTLLAGYHTAYNVIGVAVLLPLIDRFTRFVERLLPERASPLTRCLDPSALTSPIAAVEAVRRTVARALETVCSSVSSALKAAQTASRPEKEVINTAEASDALRQAQVFMSDVEGPPDTEDEQRRLTNTLHALDHASRMAETAGAGLELAKSNPDSDDARATQLCAEAMQRASSIAHRIAALPEAHPVRIRDGLAGAADTEKSTETTAQAQLAELQRCANALSELRRTHRSATLSEVAKGELTADQAIIRVDTVRNLEALTNHAWRSAAHLVGLGS
jgi:phosphate:Na+ symporter